MIWPRSIHNEDDDLLMAEAAAGVERAACGFNTCMIKPKDLKGEALFKHMVKYCLNDARAKSLATSMYLGIEHYEAQVKEFGPGAKDLRKCSIMSYTHGDGATMKLTPGSLTTLGVSSLMVACRTIPSGSVA
jgi:hypothetical protein